MFRFLHFHYRFSTKFCTLQFITYPDVVYKVATAAILIQTISVQSVFSLEKFTVSSRGKIMLERLVPARILYI